MKKALLLLLAVMLVGCSGEGTEKKKEADVKRSGNKRSGRKGGESRSSKI